MLKQEKITSVSDMCGSIFKNCQKVFDHICPVCGEKIFHTFNNLEGAEKIDFYTMCECVEKEYENKAIEELKNEKYRIVQLNKENCGFSKRDLVELKTTLEIHSGNKEAYSELIKYRSEFDEQTQIGFYLYGPVGVGKSLIAKKAMAEILNRGYSSYITNVSKLMNDIKKENNIFSRETYFKCINVDLLVLDDFGAERATEYDIEQLFMILESRWRDYKPIIFTSNLTLNEISQKYKDKDRLLSRIKGSCKVLKIDGKDHREIDI